MFAPGLLFRGREGTAKRRRDAQQRKELGARTHPTHFLLRSACVQGQHIEVVVRQSAQRVRPGTPTQHILDTRATGLSIGQHRLQADDLPGLLKGQRTQQRGPQHREHGRVRAETQRQHRHDAQRKTRRPPQRADRIAHLSQHRVH